MRRRPDSRKVGRLRGCVLALALALCASLAPATAQAAAPITWSSAAIPGGAPTAVSCASESLCVTVNDEGAGLISLAPTSSNPGWSRVLNDAGQSLNAVSCAPAGPCVAVDGAGSAFASASGWAPAPISGGGVLTGVSCPSASLCVAVNDTGDIFTSTSSGTGGWALASSHPGDDLRGVSCATEPTQTLCVAVDSAGDALSTATPSGSWTEHKIDSEELVAVSCWAAGTCVAVDHVGHVLASADPGSLEPTWSATPIDGGERLTAVSCATTGLCVAVDARGQAQASDDPTAAIPLWSPSSAGSSALEGVSCLPGGFCMAVNTTGTSFGGRVKAPEATTVKPIEVTDTGATIAGVVNPNDAVLGACSFEYGTSAAYVLSIPCSVLPAAVGGAQGVSAQLSGLALNTTYHYRVVASSPAGTAAGADESFTTAVSSEVPIVHPNPSITGTPANGQHLTCHPGTSSGTTAQLTYAWLRDQIPIAGATASTYTVKGQDTGHHLQCEVTATDGGGSATEKSAFVTIPVGGAPASAGETSIGRAAFKSGKLIVPIACSSQASGGCAVALRLTAVETLSGGRIVAIAARSTHSARKSTAGLRHRTVTLASLRLRLARGAHYSVAAALDTTGRRLLAGEHHFGASLSVTGTVIGVIEARLGQQLVTLSTGSHSASTHAARRR
jgi:hypothetical protein